MWLQMVTSRLLLDDLNPEWQGKMYDQRKEVVLAVSVLCRCLQRQRLGDTVRPDCYVLCKVG